MNSFNFDKYLDIVNDEKIKYGLDLYTPLYPMFRMNNDKFYIGVMLVSDNDEVWNRDSKVKPEYWALIDILSGELISFNKTEEKDFVNGSIIDKKYSDNQQEMSKYILEKSLKYKEFLKNDFKGFQTPMQKRLIDLLGSEVIIDGEKVDIGEYVYANIEEEVENKIDELVNMLISDKYGSIIFYYDILVAEIINEYKNNGQIDNKKLDLCKEIINDYYPGVHFIDNFFNL